MKAEQIESLIYSHIPKELIHSIEIDICELTHQPDRLKIILLEETPTQLGPLGLIMDGIDNLIVDDNYGDLVELKLDMTRYDETMGTDEFTTAYTLSFEIDS